MPALMSVRSTGKRVPASASSSRNANFIRLLPSCDCLSLDRSLRNRVGTHTHANSALGRVLYSRPSSSFKALGGRFAIDFNERIARSRRSLRAPDQALESKDERVHLWRTKWDLHYRSAEDAEALQRRDAVCRRNGCAGKDRAVCGHQTPGAGSHCRRGYTVQPVLRQPTLAGRFADEHRDGATLDQAFERAGRDGAGELVRGPGQEGSRAARARTKAFATESCG